MEEEGEVVIDTVWERKWYGGTLEGGRYDTEPYSGMEELNHSPSHGGIGEEPTRET